MSAFMLSNESISTIAKSLVTTFNDNRFSRESNYLYAGSIEKLFDDCHNKNFDYDTAKVAEKLYAMNRDALSQRYNDYSDLCGTFEYHPEVPDRIRLARQAKVTGKNRFTDITCLYKTVQCYLYQCCEGSIPSQDLYQEMEKYLSRIGKYIVESLPEYDEADWG